MKKLALPALALIASLATVQGQTIFTPGNLAVMRFSGQDSSSTTTGGTETGCTNIIDQYTTSGTLVSSFALPTSGANSLVNAGLAYAGQMTLSTGSNLLVIPGYNVTGGIPIPSANAPLTFAASTLYPREIGTLDAYGNFSIPIKSTSLFNGFTMIGAASDGTNYWAMGNGPSSAFNTGLYPEIAYMGTAAAPISGVQVGTNAFTTGTRGLEIFNVAGSLGLYGSGFSATNYGYNTTKYGSGCWYFSNLSGTLPETFTGSTNIFPDGTSSSGTGMDIAINPAGTIAYLADSSLGIIKWTNAGSGWISNYTIVPTNTGYIGSGSKEALSVTADWSQTPPVVYATTAEAFTNRLIKFQDTGSLPTIVNLAFGTTNNNVTNTYRGVKFVPVPAPEITSQPVSFTGYPGESATFSAAVLGNNTYQWYSNSAANLTYVAISGATSTNFTIPSIAFAQSGSLFYLQAINTYGTVTTIPVSLTVENPAITTEPVGSTNAPGTAATLTVAAVGNPNVLTYQWYSNSVLISGATTTSYTPSTSSGLSNSASYTVVVSNSVGSITSAPTVVSYTPVLLYDAFNYPNGNLFGDPGSPWTDINGTNPELVTNHTVQVSQAEATTDGQSLFGYPVSGTVVWSSFTLNLATLPAGSQGGDYFANVEDATNFNFYGRLFTLTSNLSSLTPGMSSTAFPGTYRLGISGKQNDSASNSSTGPDAVIPLDLAPGINYEVVFFVDMVNEYCSVAINPASYNDIESGTPITGVSSGPTGDAFTPTNAMAAFGIRQRQNEGVFYMSTLECSWDWNGIGSGYPVVTSAYIPTNPVIGLQPAGITNFAGNPYVMEVAASGIGYAGTGLTYAWYQNSGALSDSSALTGSATPALTINSLAASNSGTYYCVVTGTNGSATSSNAIISVNVTPTAPTFTVQPATNTTIAEGANVTFTATAVGTGPIMYSWYFDGVQQTSFSSSPIFTLTGVSTNQAGTYTVVAQGGQSPNATSSNAVLNVTGPVATNISYLRSLMTTGASPSVSSSSLYTVSGVVTTATNLTSGNTSSYYIQDATGGINLFITGDSTFRPALGHIVNVTGLLSIFDENLELDVTYGASFQTYTDTGMTGALPTPILLPWSEVSSPNGIVTPNLAFIQTNTEGSVVTMTNVYFAETGTFSSAVDFYSISNSAGQVFEIFYSEQETNFDGANIPAFAYSVTGPLYQNNAAFAVIVSQLSDIVSTPPPQPSVKATVGAGGHPTLTWSAAFANNGWGALGAPYTYSVWSATNVAGPYAPQASGLLFSSTNASYTDTNAATSARFYVISSP